MSPLLIIAEYTIKDCLHHRIISFALAIFCGIHGVAHVIGQSLIGSYHKIYLDSALFAYQLFSFSFIILFAIPFLKRQQNYNTFAFFLTKNISRATFIISSVLGFFIIFIMSAIIFYGSSVLLGFYLTNQWFLYLLPAYILIALEGIFISIFGFLYSLLFSSTLAYFATSATYIVCYSIQTWYLAISKTSLSMFGSMLYYFLPDLQLLDIKSIIIYQLPIPILPLFFGILYLLVWCMFVLLLTTWVFEKHYL
ncbi:MAG: hypothetical protein WDZ41_00875 [Candidatus Babeliales bacterium]